MFNLGKNKWQKAIIFIVALVFVVNEFSLLWVFSAQPAKAQGPLDAAEKAGQAGEMATPGIPVADIGVRSQNFTSKLLDELKAVFFKNILGTLLNKIAKQTAVWVASGAKGGGPKWIQNFDSFITDYAKGVVVDQLVKVVQKSTGINICTFDPTMAIKMSLDMPIFKDEFEEPTIDCDYQKLKDHWEEIGKKKFIDFSYSIGTAVKDVEETKTKVTVNTTLQVWDKIMKGFLMLGGCADFGSPYKIDIPGVNAQSVKIKCTDKPPLQQNLEKWVKALDDLTKGIDDDIKNIVLKAGARVPIDLQIGNYTVGPENIDAIKIEYNKLFDKYKDTDLLPVIDKTLENLKSCQNLKRVDLEKNCKQILYDNFTINAVPEPVSFTGAQAAYGITLFENEVTAKITYGINTINAIKTGIDFLKNKLNQNLKPEIFEQGVAYNAQLAKGVFNPEANNYAAYTQLYKQFREQALGSFFQRQLQSVVDQGWKPVEDVITKTVLTPSKMISEKAVKDLNPQNDTATVYTKSIIADAVGIFMKTLWNEYITRLLQRLGPPTPRQKIKKVAVGENPIELKQRSEDYYAQPILSVEGVQDYVDTLAEQFEINQTFSGVIDLLSDFQTTMRGEVSPNIYNNVVDSNFAQAINDKMTIKAALEKNKLIGSYKFSWGETEEIGTYNLANIKKLRKGRVVPLGLELAAELARDCNFRKTYDSEDPDTIPDYANFEDIVAIPSGYSTPLGYNNLSNPYLTQRLRNCFFKPFTEGEKTLEEIKAYNRKKMNEVINATLAYVVDSYSKIGSGICGDFDDNESAFCNLVNPNWVLKIPTTKCSLTAAGESYGEILQANSNGERFVRCNDFASCLNEDGKGGCLDEQYGFCVKEKNAWQFGVNPCPAEFDSCRTYQIKNLNETSEISYLKKTLSGSDICSAQNAGCDWYATKMGSDTSWHDFFNEFSNETDCQLAGGTWLEGECQPERIYLNRFAETCYAADASCSEFTVYRDSTNNLVPDSGFEYGQENKFPEHWDLLLKQEIGSQNLPDKASCDSYNQTSPNCLIQGNCSYYNTCFNYDYERQDLCLTYNGQWVESGLCLDGISTNESECIANQSYWAHCVGAYKNETESADCIDRGGTFREYCLTSILQYNLCEDPKLEKTDCLNYSGTWKTECQKGGQVVSILADKDTCENPPNDGVWLEYCQGAIKYNSSKKECQSLLGKWQGYGPFNNFINVSKDGTNTQNGLAKVQINTGDLAPEYELEFIYRSKFSSNDILTKAGDVFTASANIKANRTPTFPILFSLIGGENEINSKGYYLSEEYSEASSTLMTANDGNDIEMRISLPAEESGTIVYIDNVSLALNSLEQVRNLDFYRSYSDYDLNSKVYYKKPPAELNCHGYTSGDAPPVLAAKYEDECNADKGYWDLPVDGVGVFANQAACYRYGPDDPACSNYMKVCQPEEAGCQIYTPVNGEPAIPGVVSLMDYCPAECVGYQTYKQEPTLYEPMPDPLFDNFIATTATACTLDEVGCSQFTNLDEVARGGEGIGYFTYLRQCIKPNLGLGEKTFFTWQSSETGPPQLIKYLFQQDASGAPKTLDQSGDCQITLGQNDLNCIKFFDSDGKEYYRDIRVTISVSDDCHPFRKIESTQENCQATNGRWQIDANACLYDAIPLENISCRAEANGCRAYIGNQGNNVYYQIFDTFEDNTLDWYVGTTGEDTGGLEKTSESLVLGGHSLAVPINITEIHKTVDLQKGNIYLLSFWAKSISTQGDVLAAYFTDSPNNKSFADTVNQKINLSNNWKYFTLGPIYVDWDLPESSSLIIGGISDKIYLDNIVLKVIRDNVYVVKKSWSTPDTCNQDFFGITPPADEPPPMLGCEAYTDYLAQTHYLKSFTNLCRSSAAGCQILIDTHNSTNPNTQNFNEDNDSSNDPTKSLDNYTVPKDELATYVLDNNFSCTAGNKGCQKLGKQTFETGGTRKFEDIYLKNKPDIYIDSPYAIMCNEESLGCTELRNEAGSFEYYKIDATKLCQYDTKEINGQDVSGWFKIADPNSGCGSLPPNTKIGCEAEGYFWSEKYGQCTFALEDIKDKDLCLAQNGEWLVTASQGVKCLISPFTIYKIQEANKYAGYVGQCDVKYNGCTEFVDINPNFVANGGFEFISDEVLSQWNAKQSERLGSYKIFTDKVLEGTKALQLSKRSNKDSTEQVFGLSQRISLLEKGKTYKISFYFQSPEGAAGRGADCPVVPGAAFELNSLDGYCNNPLYTSQKECESGASTWNLLPKGEIYKYAPETDWKKVEVIYTVPTGLCSNSSYLDKAGCTAANATWHELNAKQDYELIIFAPTNEFCPDSFVNYDLIEIKDNTEDSYYVIDKGENLNRSVCSTIDWDSGCVQFFNSDKNIFETIQVKKDRNCEEWAVCTQQDAKGRCQNVDLCTAQSGGVCITLSAKMDNVRYDYDKSPLDIKRISDFQRQQGYIYRFGGGTINQLNEWRAGDYSGYTIANRLPLETELKLDIIEQFKTYPTLANLVTDDKRYVKPICEVFPSNFSPLPYQLSLVQGFTGLQSLFSPSITELADIGNSCFYEKVEAVNTASYFPRDYKISESNPIGVTKICTGPLEKVGVDCSESAGVCETKSGMPTDTCKEIEKVTKFAGLENMCLEYDTLNPLYDNIYQRIYGSAYDYQPYACLSYFPFYIDTCKLDTLQADCNLNPLCFWQKETKTCIIKP